MLRRLEKKVDAVASLLDRVSARCGGGGRGSASGQAVGWQDVGPSSLSSRSGMALAAFGLLQQGVLCRAQPRAAWARLRTPPLGAPPALQNALELLEARMAGGLVKLESRLAAVEEAAGSRQPQQTQAGGERGVLRLPEPC